MANIKSYRPVTSSIVSGQVLQYPYTAEKARLVVREMADALALDLVEKGMVTGQLTLTVGYDIENLADPDTRRQYQGEVTVDRYGRRVPKHAHGTANLDRQTSSSLLITDAVAALYDRIINPRLLVRRISLSANRIVPASSVKEQEIYEQLDLFTDYAALRKEQEEEKRILEREQKMQKAMLEIKKKYGKNAILKGISLEEGATARERNRQIGGHKA